MSYYYIITMTTEQIKEALKQLEDRLIELKTLNEQQTVEVASLIHIIRKNI